MYFALPSNVAFLHYIQHKDYFLRELMGLNRHIILKLSGVSAQSIRAMILYLNVPLTKIYGL